MAEILQIVQLHLDWKYKIRELFGEFDNFLPRAANGTARKMQPVYRHTFCHGNPKSRVGDPAPEGLPGFNSGVMLLNLEAVHQSAPRPFAGACVSTAAFRRVPLPGATSADQDFFTMIGLKHPELSHVLDCTWYRQSCTWWKDHGYSDVFQAHFHCEGHVEIYHGNSTTPVPAD